MKRLIGMMVICLGILMLAACGGQPAGSEEAASSDNPGNAYRVITVDETGTPVPGVQVQLCSDQMCVMGETDADGIATFEQDEGLYTVHVYSVPGGYAEDTTEYPVPETYGDVSITLKTAE